MIMIGYWRDNAVRPFACDAVHCNLLQQKCLNKWIGSALIGKRNYNLKPANTNPVPSTPLLLNHRRWRIN